MSVILFGGNEEVPVTFWQFPGGERGVRITKPELIEKYKSFTIICAYKSSNDLLDILMLVDACRNTYSNVRLRLKIPYFPYARQDRASNVGEAHSLRVAANIIKSCDFYEIEVWDPHSDVLEALFPAGKLSIRTQEQIWASSINAMKAVLAVPDAGAAKKVKCKWPVLYCSKTRDSFTGEISASTVPYVPEYNFNTFVVLDDICDGGATFSALGSELRKTYQITKLVLCVTHGIFSKGLPPLEVFDEIYTVNNLSNENLNKFNERNYVRSNSTLFC